MNRLGITIAAAASVAAFTGALLAANGQTRLRASATSPAPNVGAIPEDLPALPKGPMTVTRAGDTLSVLQFDDNTCESGLGVGGAQISDLVEFDPTPPCTTAGPLTVMNVTARINTGSAVDFVLHNPGATPGMPNAANVTRPITPITAAGPCPATGGLVQRAVTPPAAFSPGNATNFFAGIRTVASGAFAGRDTTTNALRMWILCATCGMTQYTPAQLTALGFPGNWMIRVTVEDAACVPVELQDFEVSD